MTMRLSAFAALLGTTAVTAADPPPRVFLFGQNGTGPMVTRVAADATYAKGTGYGFEPGATVRFADGVCSSDKPFCFSVAVPEGNYSVQVTFGDKAGESDTTVKSELRRLSVERVKTERGQTAGKVFAVSVRTSGIATGGEVKLKDREKTSERWNWDEKLTLEFNGPKPRVSMIAIAPVAVTTVYLLGDSTVCDQPGEPYASWGQMLPVFFEGSIAVANHAQSGESLRSSLGARRLDKVLSTIKPGDWLMLQYGHNDMKAVTADVYKKDLKHFADEAKKKGANVILITPMHRRTFKDGKVTNSHKDFPDAVRSLAKEESLPLIDLHAMSATLYESFGPEKSAVLFKSGDGTHHNNYGAYLLAQCVVEGISGLYLEDKLHRHLRLDRKRFDPAKPDPVESFAVPASPTQGAKPEGK
jgi:lysophospholipase L1-like esterase